MAEALFLWLTGGTLMETGFRKKIFFPILQAGMTIPFIFDVDNDQLQDTRSVRLINKRLKEDGSKSLHK